MVEEGLQQNRLELKIKGVKYISIIENIYNLYYEKQKRNGGRDRVDIIFNSLLLVRTRLPRVYHTPMEWESHQGWFVIRTKIPHQEMNLQQ